MSKKTITLSISLIGMLILKTSAASSFDNIQRFEIIQNQNVRIICTYTFDGVKDEMQIEKLKAELSLLQGVEGIKSFYKPEKGAGQIIVYILQKQRTSEADEMFDITRIKKAIIAQNLNPVDVKITEEIIK
jgi:hypothetical protein